MSDLKSILFVDLETVAQHKNYYELTDSYKRLWKAQAKQSYIERDHISPAETTEEQYSDLYLRKAAIHSEFGKIICIGMGYFVVKEGVEPELRVKVLQNTDEKALLEQFAKISEKFLVYCAHNGKKFDYPYLARRMLMNGMKVPPILDTRNLKPWEIIHIDTQEMWRFGDMVYPSLELLSHSLGVPLTKSIEGEEIHNVYYSGDIKRIVDYCAEDIITLAKVYVKLNNPSLEVNKVLIA